MKELLSRQRLICILSTLNKTTAKKQVMNQVQTEYNEFKQLCGKIVKNDNSADIKEVQCANTDVDENNNNFDSNCSIPLKDEQKTNKYSIVNQK